MATIFLIFYDRTTIKTGGILRLIFKKMFFFKKYEEGYFRHFFTILLSD